MKLGVIVQTETKQISSVVQQFSRFAHKYDSYNIIQSKVATHLVEKLSMTSYKNMIDIGCGSGEVYKNILNQHIDVEHFVALDSSQAMLDIHPQNKHIVKVCSDFNNKNFLTTLAVKQYDVCISSSALQWSNDLSYTISQLSLLSSKFYGAIFTSGTFKTLHTTAAISSPVPSVFQVQEAIEAYYQEVIFELCIYRLEFPSTRDMFRYIKQSGVSSGERKLSYKETKKLMNNYPLNYLEFEVLFIDAKK